MCILDKIHWASCRIHISSEWWGDMTLSLPNDKHLQGSILKTCDLWDIWSELNKIVRQKIRVTRRNYLLKHQNSRMSTVFCSLVLFWHLNTFIKTRGSVDDFWFSAVCFRTQIDFFILLLQWQFCMNCIKWHWRLNLGIYHADDIVECAGKFEEAGWKFPTEQSEPVLVSQYAFAIEPEWYLVFGQHFASHEEGLSWTSWQIGPYAVGPNSSWPGCLGPN